MSESTGYRAVIVPDGSVQVRPPGGIPVYRMTPDQIKVLWATFEDGSLDRRLDAGTDDQKAELWRAVKHLRKAGLLASGRSYTNLEFSEIGLDIAQFLFGKWSGCNLHHQKYIT